MAVIRDQLGVTGRAQSRASHGSIRVRVGAQGEARAELSV